MKYEDSLLYEVHLHWAKWTISILRLRFPEIRAKLFKNSQGFNIVVESMPDGLTHEIFHNSIRPITCNIDLCLTPPLNNEYVDDFVDYNAELWLSGQPLSVSDLNQLLMLTSNKFPLGGIDFDVQKDEWVFTTVHDLDARERALVVEGLKNIGQKGKISFAAIGPNWHTQGKRSKHSYDAMQIIPSQSLSSTPTIKSLVEQDEDNWREFVSQHSQRNFDLTSPVRKFSCLFDIVDSSDIKLSELLCLYDQINIIPELNGTDWLTKHHLTLDNLQSLIQMGRVSLVLPHSVNRYPKDIILAAAEADPMSLTLSRTLAAKTFQQGLQKDPLLYAPLSSHERALLLGLLSENSDNDNFSTALDVYGNLFERQQFDFVTRGAAATLGSGIGSHLGELVFRLKGLDTRLELMTNGAALEWALALGANYIPRNIGGFDETKNSLFLASFLGKTPFKITDPFTSRMHTAIDGLLSVSNVPPIEVARNFNSLTLIRFRNLATRIMKQFDKQEDIESVVKLLNADVKSFESKKDKLKAWKIDSLVVGGIAKPFGDAIDVVSGGFSSVIAFWLMEVIKSKISPKMHNELNVALDMLVALATLSPIDAVIVSRSKKF